MWNKTIKRLAANLSRYFSDLEGFGRIKHKNSVENIKRIINESDYIKICKLSYAKNMIIKLKYIKLRKIRSQS